MPRDAIERARTDRNAALVDAMLLVASADGVLHPKEMQALLTAVIERPEFEGTDARELSELVEASARRLSHARALEEIHSSLRQRLPDHRARLLAFGLATSVALANRTATRTELGVLKGLQAALAITEAEVTRMFEVVEAKVPLAEALGEPLEQLYADVMVLVGAADGHFSEHELTTMLENMAGDPAFKDVSLEVAERYLKQAIAELVSEGVPTRLATLAQGLTTRAQRHRAFRLALHVAYSDGNPSKATQQLLELLQASFRLTDDEVAKITVESHS